MAEHTFDRFAKLWGSGMSRRRMLRLVGASAGLAAATQLEYGTTRADDGCLSNDDCDPGMVCEGGFCLFPACYPLGSACVSHDDCCDDGLCLDAICSVSPRCGLETESCGADGDCCPGMICSSGICTIFIPTTEAPSNNSGNSGGGGDSGGGSPTSPNNGAEAEGYHPSSSGMSPATTSGGVSVSSLPSTGTGSGHGHRRWLGAAAVAAGGAAAMLGLRTVSEQETELEPSVSPEQD